MTEALLTGSAASAPARAAAARWAVGAVAAILLLAWLAPAIAPAAWHEVDLPAARQAPSLAHWFGTDNAGRDLLVRVGLGLRVSLTIAAVCAVTSTLLGVAVGVLAAARSGVVDGVLMRVTDAANALPHLLLGIVIVAFFPGSPVAIVASIALTHWPQVARIVRSVAIGTRQMEFVEAAYLAGATRTRVAVRHLVPATFGQAAVALVLLLPHAIWHESTLSFLGLGLSPDQPSLGTLLAISRGEIMVGGRWTLLFPAAALVVTTLAVSALAGEAQRRWAPLPEGRLG